MLDWNDLRSFLEVARRGKLTLAGKRLNVEPTTVGRHIARLEKELGVHLFDRSPKGYSLNDNGYKLVTHSENIETKINSIYQSVSGTDTILTGTVRMAVPEGLGIGITSKHIKAFKDQHIPTPTQKDANNWAKSHGFRPRGLTSRRNISG